VRCCHLDGTELNKVYGAFYAVLGLLVGRGWCYCPPFFAMMALSAVEPELLLPPQSFY